MARRGIRFNLNYRTAPRWHDRDPMVDAAQTALEDERLTPHQAHEICGVATGTINNWLSGKTKRPQNQTMDAFTSALGYVRRDDIDEDGKLVHGLKKVKRYDYVEEREKQATFLIKEGRAPKPRRKKKKRGNGVSLQK